MSGKVINENMSAKYGATDANGKITEHVKIQDTKEENIAR